MDKKKLLKNIGIALGAAYKQFCETGVPETSGDIGPYTRRATARALARLLESV